jgi:RNA polymerase sigma factor (sigma-70 family)
MNKSQNQQLLTWLPRLRSYARALCGNREDADDLVQSTLERAWLKATLWRGVADMRGWLFGIMHNLHVDSMRRARIPMVPIDDSTPEIPVPPGQGDRLAVMELAAALQQLPPEQREVLLLVALEDMPYADVAKALGIPVGTVMSRLARGRERLRRLMAGQAEPQVVSVRLKLIR